MTLLFVNCVMRDRVTIVVCVCVNFCDYIFAVHLQVVSQAVQYSIDEFVVELLVRMCEPHTANTHLAKYCR